MGGIFYHVMNNKISAIRFQLETDAIETHRYKSIDDWWNPREWCGEVHFKTVTADTGNRKYNFLVLIHALIEQYLCFEKGITDEKVCEWDMTHTHCDDPGSHEEAPYHDEHQIAEAVERMLSEKLGVDWDTYGKAIDKTLSEWGKEGDGA
jgi:hypothetical protein